MAEPLPLSVCLIAHNEEANLPRCLASVAGLAAEVVVVVNNCTDQTVAIATAAGARVFEHAWQGHRDQKNLALGHATQPWVLALDADEELSPALRTAIAAFVRADDPSVIGARFPRCTRFLGRWIRHGEWYPDWSLRLARRGRCRWTGVSEHDTLSVDGPVATLRGPGVDLLHFSFPNLASHHRKIAYFGARWHERTAAAGQRFSAAAAVSRSLWRFFRAYFLKGGCLDGFPGLYIAAATAYAVFYKHSLLYESGLAAPAPGGQAPAALPVKR